MNHDIAFMEWKNIPFRVVDDCGTYTEIRLIPNQNPFTILYSIDMIVAKCEHEHILMKVYKEDITDFYFKISRKVPGLSGYRL